MLAGVRIMTNGVKDMDILDVLLFAIFFILIIPLFPIVGIFSFLDI